MLEMRVKTVWDVAKRPWKVQRYFCLTEGLAKCPPCGELRVHDELRWSGGAGPVFASAQATVRSGVRGLGRQIQLISGHESKRSLEVY